jgi:uncharacterized protein
VAKFPVIDVQELENFVRPFYVNDDTMHDISHARRILKAAKKLARYYQTSVDIDLLIFACYFHGMIIKYENEIAEFLKALNLPEKRIHLALKVSWESLKEKVPETLEGKIVHDAHLIEGGKTFMVVKSLVTGSLRGQTLEETIEYLENNVIGRFNCYLPRAQKIYAEKERFAKNFLSQLKKDLAP